MGRAAAACNDVLTIINVPITNSPSPRNKYYNHDNSRQQWTVLLTHIMTPSLLVEIWRGQKRERKKKKACATEAKIDNDDGDDDARPNLKLFTARGCGDQWMPTKKKERYQIR